MLFASLRLLTSLTLSQPCFGAVIGVLGPSFLHPPSKITQLYPTFFSRVVARYKRGSGCGALRSVFILAMPPFTTLKISPSFGFWLTDSLSENCTGLASWPPSPQSPAATLSCTQRNQISIITQIPLQPGPYFGLCVKYHIAGFSRVYCLKLRAGRGFHFSKVDRDAGGGRGKGGAGWLNTIFVI